MKLYVIYDKIAEKSGPIFHADNDAVAIRGYNRLVNNGEIEPEDYQLMCVGEYDDRTMDIQTCLPCVVEVAICPAHGKAVSVDPKLPEDVKKDLGRTCVNCIHSFVRDFGENEGRLICNVENEFCSPEYTCKFWRCK